MKTETLFKLILGLFILSSGAFVVSSKDVVAEPWLGTRFAQNCAGCHAPQRINTPPSERRCSLSCQGCHVNPNGGGLRSHYGKWNGNRWLKTWRSDRAGHDRNFAIYKNQLYGKKKWKENLPKNIKKLVKKRGLPLVEKDGEMNEPLYDRRYGRAKVIYKNREHYLYQVPEGDPWRQMALSKFDGGVDLRWYMAQADIKVNGEKQKRWTNFLMAADFGLRYRPIYRKVHFVYETRMFGNPQPGTEIEDTLKASTTRSLYGMVDDLPFNIFVQGGYYRPLFGNYVPDHTALSQQMQSYTLQGNYQAYNLVYEAVTIGTAPNVPYGNIHLLRKNINDPDSALRGWGANVGLRFVTLGGSLNLSYWRSTDDRGGEDIREVEMYSFVAGAIFANRVTAFYEGNSYTRDKLDDDYRRGGVHTIDTHTKVWKEMYYVLNFALANTAKDLTEGSANQVKTGVRTFIIPGLDVTLLYEMESEEKKQTDTKVERNAISTQLHAYF